MTRQVRQSEIEELCYHLVTVLIADASSPESRELAPEAHANKTLTSLLTAYALIAASRKEPQDLIDEATKFLNHEETRRRMVRMRARYPVLEF